MKDKVVIVTGSSGGIGKALAYKFASMGSHVVLNGRNHDKLYSIHQDLRSKGFSAIVIPGDVSSESDCRILIEETISEFGRIDVLINNAGVSMRALFAETDLSVIRKVMDINFWGTVYCTKYAIDHIITSKGSIVGISSVAGKKGLPGRTGYSASKFAMEGFLESLRLENAMKGIHVLVACPGFTASKIRESSLNASGSSQKESPREEKKMMTAQQVAEKVYTSIVLRKRDLILTKQGKLAIFINKFFPKWADKLTFDHMSKEPGSPF